ncbi:MAG: YchF/TatD family DNA exonuclease [Deltaproteobacteria bacterium]|nr:YchF/TatD family DNA exonuclease [Deltaproteobacteria bacterium]
MSNQYKLIDTHAHLDDPKFKNDLDDVIKRAKDAGVGHIITVGTWQIEKGLKHVAELADEYDFIYTALGVHPHDAKDANDDAFNEIKELALHPKVIAIGETGLDYHYEHSPRDVQKAVFARQIQIARELNLPLTIHSREAQNDTLDMLAQEGVRDIGGVLHCFSGSYEMAKKCLDMGLYLSFTGVVTFPKAANVHEVVKKIPIERMLLETDCPYLAPEPHRGKRNEPAFVAETGKRISEIKGLSFDDVARITTLNAKELFGIEKENKETRIAYPIRNSLYLNITNRCTNYCTFCAKHAPAGFKRGSNDYTVKGHYLRLKQEPVFLDVIMAVGDRPAEKYNEIVFCGFGEPLIRLDLVKEVGLFLKKQGCKIRIDTDGLANLVHERNILPELKFVDTISVSLNAPDSATYQKLIKTPFGDKAFPAIVWFLKEAKKHISTVVATVVAVPELDIEPCRKLAEDELGVGFRVREYDEVG